MSLFNSFEQTIMNFVIVVFKIRLSISFKMDVYNLVLGVFLIVVGLFSASHIIDLKTNRQSTDHKDKIDHNDYRLYIGAIGGIGLGLFLLIKELISLVNTL